MWKPCRQDHFSGAERCRSWNSNSNSIYLDPQSSVVNALKLLGNSSVNVDFIMASPFAAPHFFRQPIRYLRWASHEKPAIFYSCCISMVGPLSFVVVPPIRRFFGDGPREKIPMTYPGRFLRIDVDARSQKTLLMNHYERDANCRTLVPKGPRKIPEGYDDE